MTPLSGSSAALDIPASSRRQAKDREPLPALAPVLLMAANMAALALLLVWMRGGAKATGAEEWVAAYLGASLATVAELCLIMALRGLPRED